MTQDVLKYLQPNAAVPIDMETTSLLVNALRQAMESQEPVAWPCLIAEADFSQNTVTLTMQCTNYKISAGKHWLFTTPPQRTWVGLTPEEILDMLDAENVYGSKWLEFARAVEAKLKEKNT